MKEWVVECSGEGEGGEEGREGGEDGVRVLPAGATANPTYIPPLSSLAWWSAINTLAGVQRLMLVVFGGGSKVEPFLGSFIFCRLSAR